MLSVSSFRKAGWANRATKSPAERIEREHLRQCTPSSNRRGVISSLGRDFDNTRGDRFTTQN